MQYELRMQPEVPPMSWKQFCKTSPPFSIAIDGYVNTGPMFDPSGPRQNFNHHEDVDRLGTRATCAQALLAIRQGLFDCFRDEHSRKIIAYANDCDQDVCTTSFLFKYGYIVEHTMNPMLNRLVEMEDKLDATAGAYPYPPDLPVLGELAWVYEPYTRFRLGGGLERKCGADFLQVVTDVEFRIMKHIVGGGGSIPLDFRYKRVGGGKDWSLVVEVGTQARTKMFSDGIHAYVSVRERPDGKSWTYTIGRMSHFVPFDIPRFFTVLNEAEGIDNKSRDRWGGANIVGGSPRVSGSKLSPSRVQDIINATIG